MTDVQKINNESRELKENKCMALSNELTYIWNVVWMRLN